MIYSLILLRLLIKYLNKYLKFIKFRLNMILRFYNDIKYKYLIDLNIFLNYYWLINKVCKIIRMKGIKIDKLD